MGVLQEMFSADARVDLGDGHFSDGVMIVKAEKPALALTTKSFKDGDGDGVVFDGTPQERPVSSSEDGLSQEVMEMTWRLRDRKDYPNRFQKFFNYDWSAGRELTDEEFGEKFDLLDEFKDEFTKYMTDDCSGFESLDPDEKDGRRKVVRQIFDAVGPRIVQKLVKEIGDTWHHRDADHLTQSVMSFAGRSKELIQKRMQSNSRAAGSYAYPEDLSMKGILFLGSGSDLPNEQNKTLRPQNTAIDTYAHEFGHVLGLQGRISNTKEWMKIWNAEIRGGMITQYATVNPEEGFAEAFRLYANDKTHLRLSFPQSFQFIKASFDRNG